MKTLDGVYKAVCLDVVGQVIHTKVPQVFADEVVTCMSSAGVVPAAGQQGWIAFESGFPDRPVWVGVNFDVPPPPPEGGPGVDTLNELTDVDTTGMTDGTSLVFNGTSGLWVPETPLLDDLADVDVTTSPPDDGNVLSWDVAAQQWVAADVLGSIDWSQVLAAEVLTTDGSGKGRTWYGPPSGTLTPVEGDLFIATIHSADPPAPIAPPAGAPTVTVS